MNTTHLFTQYGQIDHLVYNVSALSYVNIVYLYQYSTFLPLCTPKWLMKWAGNLSGSRRNIYLQFFYYSLGTIQRCQNEVGTMSLKRYFIVQRLFYISLALNLKENSLILHGKRTLLKIFQHRVRTLLQLIRNQMQIIKLIN